MKSSGSNSVSVPQNNGNTGANNNNNQQNQTLASTQAPVSGFPNNVPVYQSSTLMLSTKSTRGGHAVVYSATYTTNNQASSVVNYYHNQLSSGGWHLDNQTQNGNATTIQATGNGEQLYVLISPLLQQVNNGTGAGATGFQLAVTPNA